MLREEQRPQKRLLQKSRQIIVGSSEVAILSVRPLVGVKFDSSSGFHTKFIVLAVLAQIYQILLF